MAIVRRAVFDGDSQAFFGPAKYGILPEILRPSDLPGANGLLLMSTFLAIIFGTVVAGVLLKYFGDRLWVASLSCMSIAVAGTVSALWFDAAAPANPHLKFELAALGRASRYAAAASRRSPVVGGAAGIERILAARGHGAGECERIR